MSGGSVALWEWDDTNKVWVKKPAVVRTASANAEEQAVLGACKLYWIACTPESTGSEFELSDDTDGSTAEVFCHFDSDKHSEVLSFSPPMQFTNGIYVKKFDKIKCLHFGYV